MEGVAADWEQPQAVMVGEFVETNGAVEGLFQTHNIFVQEHRQGVDEGLVEA